MTDITSYLTIGILIIVVILLIWSLTLIREDKKRKSSMRTRLADLKKKVENLPDATPEEREKKEALQSELILEYLENVLGEMDKIREALAKKGAEGKSSRKKGK